MERKHPLKRRGRPPGSSAGNTRERILRVARERFSAVGFERANYEDIGRLAGLSRTALYSHFPTKADLYRALYVSAQEAVLGPLIARALARTGFRRRLATFFQSAVEINQRDPTHGRFLATSLVDGLRNPQFCELAHAEAELTAGFVRDAVGDAVDTGELPAELDQDALVALLTSAMWGSGIYSTFIGTNEHVGAAFDLLDQVLARAFPTTDHPDHPDRA